jgi:hypothetical protein
MKHKSPQKSGIEQVSQMAFDLHEVQSISFKVAESMLTKLINPT